MIFNRHYGLDGSHAKLSASKYSWIRYDDDQFDQWLETSLAAQKGTELHQLASDLIRLGVNLPRNTKTLNSYVNDAIGFRMTPEQLLFFSDNAYGTADAISFREERGHVKPVLRIHDLKNGVTKASFDQLKIYAAFFCHEYRHNPFEIDMEFRIYQNDAIAVVEGDPDEIMRIKETAKRFDRIMVERKLALQGL